MFYIILTIIIAIVSVIVTIAICLQEAKSSGLGAGIAGGSETYWSKNKGRTKEGRLVRITTIAAVIFFVLAILLNVKVLVNPAEAASNTQADTAIEEVADDAAGEAEDLADDAAGEAEDLADDAAGEVEDLADDTAGEVEDLADDTGTEAETNIEAATE